MTIRFEDLSVAIERNDGPAVVECLRGATETERRAVSGKVRALVKSGRIRGPLMAGSLGLLGTAGGVRQAARDLVEIDPWTTEAVEVLRDRNPHWIAELPRALLTGSAFSNHWRLVRSLVRAGLVAKPAFAEYITRMPNALASESVLKIEKDARSVEQQLLDDPGLLDDEVFQLFRVEGSATALYWADAWLPDQFIWQGGKRVRGPSAPDETWQKTLARMARRGQIDFSRLLDESIAVFLRDLRPTHFGWYVDMHDELAPTLDEMQPRATEYQRLLAADTSLGVGVGQRALEQLLRAGRLDVESFIRASGPALARGEKGIVTKQLKLLDLALKQRSELGAQVLEVISPALVHERPEIQEVARAFAERLSGGQRMRSSSTPTLAVISQADADLEAALLARAGRLVDHPMWGPQIESSLKAIKAGVPPPGSTIPVAAGKALPPPIADPEEVVETFIRLVENARDPILIERAIAGAVRTARVPVAQRARISAPLAKRAREQLPGWPSGLTSGDVRAMVASVAYTWSTGTRVAASFGRNYTDFAIRHSPLDERLEPVTPTGILAVRCIEAIDLIAKGVETELLAEPTHERGAIDPDAFLERTQKTYHRWIGATPPRFDIEAAALRIRPGALDRSLREIPQAVRDRVTALLNDVATWIEAEMVTDRPREHRSDDARLVVLARVQQMGSRSTVLRRLTNLNDPVSSYFRLSGEGEYITGYGAAIRTWPLLTPWLPELTAAHLLRPLSRALQPGKHDHGPSAVGCLMHPDTPLGRLGNVALAMGCMGAEGDTRTAARDALVASARDGRLQPAQMAEALLDLARAGAFQAKRLESTLKPITTEPACGLRVAQTLQVALGPLLAMRVRDMHVLVRLTASLGESYGVFPDDASLDGNAGQSAGTELAKALHALGEARKSDRRATTIASLELLQGLLDRAER